MSTCAPKTLRDVLSRIHQRKETSADQSYVASLMQSGRDRILRKVGEEAAEVIIAGKNQDSQELVSELTDLYFHTLVLMADANLEWDAIEEEFGKRFDHSGLRQ